MPTDNLKPKTATGRTEASLAAPPGWVCLICGRPVPDYRPEYCCNGFECGCHGQPRDPCVCLPECGDAVFSWIGESYETRRVRAGIALFSPNDQDDSQSPAKKSMNAPQTAAGTLLSPSPCSPFFVFDVESVGLHGEAFAVAGGIDINAAAQSSSGSAAR